MPTTGLYYVKRLKNILKSDEPVKMLFRFLKRLKTTFQKSLQTFSIKGGVKNYLKSTVVVTVLHTRDAGHTTTSSPKLFMIEL